MNYSEMLKEILKESHWTQEQLATKLGVSFATVNSWINGRTEPQKSLAPEIQKLYLAQDVTNEPEPVYITLVNVEPWVRIGDYVILKKDDKNDYDDEAIQVYLMGNDREPTILNDDFLQPMYVANSVNTVVRGTRSSGRIYDKFNHKARAQIMFVTKTRAIAKIVNWNIDKNEDFSKKVAKKA